MTTTDRIGGLSASVAIKAPCRVATTAAIALSGLQTIDGVILDSGDRVLVKDQSDHTENGIYVVSTSAWSRAKDFDGARDVAKGTFATVSDGTVNGNSIWQVTTANPIVFDTSDIEFEITNNQLVGASAFVETLLSAADAGAFQEAIGFSAFVKTLVDDETAADARTTLGLQTAGGTWTPVLTFATPGNLSVSYTIQFGSYQRIGKVVWATFNILTSSFTHTTASGNLNITGLPLASANVNDQIFFGEGRWAGIAKANYTDVRVRLPANGTTISFGISGSGQTAAIVQSSDVPTGGAVALQFSFFYFVD